MASGHRSSVARRLIVAALLSPGLASAPALAGPHAAASLALHLEPAGTADPCFESRAIPGCGALVIQTPALVAPYYVHVLIEHADAIVGMGGAGFGIWHSPGVDMLSWNLCADAQTPVAGWPASGGGNRITWTAADCQHGDASYGSPATHGLAHLGWFYLAAYMPAQVAIIPHPITHEAELLDCAGGSDDLAGRGPSALGMAGFGGAAGYDPCPEPLAPHECLIDGPSAVTAGAAGLVYTASDFGQCGMAAGWSITGNGVIVGPDDQASVTVTAGATGSFTLDFWLTDVECGAHCAKTVTVEDAVPVLPTTWSRLKTLHTP